MINEQISLKNHLYERAQNILKQAEAIETNNQNKIISEVMSETLSSIDKAYSENKAEIEAAMFQLALYQGARIEEARTIVVNTLVVLEIFYLFSVRYLKASSITWQGIMGTPAVLIAVGTVTALQFLFTYAPFMGAFFDKGGYIGDHIPVAHKSFEIYMVNCLHRLVGGAAHKCQ